MTKTGPQSRGYGAGVATLALAGDVMLGRGVDQILPRPGDPGLREGYVRDARAYVELAEGANGPIPRPVDFAWPWGDALELLDEAAPDVRVVNLETSVTRGSDFAPGKAVHYRMSPANLPCLEAGRPDVTVLANNHVLDFGLPGLADTLHALHGAGLRTAGAGANAAEARRPAVVPAAGAGAVGRVLVYSFGLASSGIPVAWAATAQRPGVHLLRDLSGRSVAGLLERVDADRRPGDVVIASIHWGSNWGYHVPREQIRFAHALVDGGVDVVHGHSSHHPRPIEVHRERLVLYGCGDFIDDYEGIRGHEEFRDDLRVLYLVSVDQPSGRFVDGRLAVFQARRMRLHRASSADVAWLAGVLDAGNRGLGARVERLPDGLLAVRA